MAPIGCDFHSGGITWDAFEEQLHTKEMMEFFKMIDVDIDDAKCLFDMLDVDGSGSVDAQESDCSISQDDGPYLELLKNRKIGILEQMRRLTQL